MTRHARQHQDDLTAAGPPPSAQTVQPPQLHLPQFEGALELLLHLIERRELEITAISVAAVAEQFVEWTTNLAGGTPALMVDLLAMAARLVLIKSRALLPQPVAAIEASGNELDDAELLAEQLREYRQVRAMALVLTRHQQQGRRAYPRSPEARSPLRPAIPLIPMSLDELTRVICRRLLELPATPTAIVMTPAISLPERIAAIEGSLSQTGRTSLARLLADVVARAEIIVTFIALLELLRRRRINILQPTLFGDIEIVATEPATAGSEREAAEREAPEMPPEPAGRLGPPPGRRPEPPAHRGAHG